MTTELKACPFCGTEPTVRRSLVAYKADGKHPAGEYEESVSISCHDCGYEMADEYREDVSKKWNTRAEAAEADNKRLRKAMEPFASYGEDHFDKDHEGNMLPDEGVVGWVYLNFGHFRKARAALERMSHDKND